LLGETVWQHGMGCIKGVGCLGKGRRWSRVAGGVGRCCNPKGSRKSSGA